MFSFQMQINTFQHKHQVLLSAGTVQQAQSPITLVLKLPFYAVFLCLRTSWHISVWLQLHTVSGLSEIQITVCLSDNLPVTSATVAQRSHVDAQPLGDPDASGVVQSTSMIYDSFLIFQRLLPTSQINWMGKCDVGERLYVWRYADRRAEEWGGGGGDRKCERTAEGRDEANFHIIRGVKC